MAPPMTRACAWILMLLAALPGALPAGPSWLPEAAAGCAGERCCCAPIDAPVGDGCAQPVPGFSAGCGCGQAPGTGHVAVSAVDLPPAAPRTGSQLAPAGRAPQVVALLRDGPAPRPEPPVPRGR